MWCGVNGFWDDNDGEIEYTYSISLYGCQEWFIDCFDTFIWELSMKELKDGHLKYADKLLSFLIQFRDDYKKEEERLQQIIEERINKAEENVE